MARKVKVKWSHSVTLVENPEALRGYDIIGESGVRIPATHYEVILWKMYCDAVAKIERLETYIRNLEKQLNECSVK